ncbi:MAG: hypothetical protein ACE5JS_19415 [Nitrospinota bacterium]
MCETRAAFGPASRNRKGLEAAPGFEPGVNVREGIVSALRAPHQASRIEAKAKGAFTVSNGPVPGESGTPVVAEGGDGEPGQGIFRWIGVGLARLANPVSFSSRPQTGPSALWHFGIQAAHDARGRRVSGKCRIKSKKTEETEK